MPGGLRLTDVLARLGLFSGDLGAWPAAAAEPERLSADVAAALDGLRPAAAAWLRDPLGRADPPPVWTPRALLLPDGRTAARQVSPTTCGSAVLAVLALAGDSRLALRLARADDVGGAFAALQHRWQHATTRGPGGIPTWPRGLGTPPWAAARRARFGAVRYAHRVVGPDGGALEAALAAAAVGLPVPLYTGGDTSGGLVRAVPRHVVLLCAVHDERPHGRSATLYEPSSGALHTLPVDVLRADARDGRGVRDDGRHDPRATAARTRALGGWPHVVWAVLPCART